MLAAEPHLSLDRLLQVSFLCHVPCVSSRLTCQGVGALQERLHLMALGNHQHCAVCPNHAIYLASGGAGGDFGFHWICGLGIM